MTTTTTPNHRFVIEAHKVLIGAADLLSGEGFQKGYGLFEAFDESAQVGELSRVGRVVAERWCVMNGLDVWWSDLLCEDGDQAAWALMGLPSIDPLLMYGPQWEAQLGLFAMAEMLTAAQINGLANMTGTRQLRANEYAIEVADGMGRGLLLEHCRQDANFCAAHYASTPAGVQRRLRAMIALQGVAAYHVLLDVLPVEVAVTLTEPVMKLLLPLQTSL